MKKSILLCGVNIEHLKTLKYHIFLLQKISFFIICSNRSSKNKKRI